MVGIVLSYTTLGIDAYQISVDTEFALPARKKTAYKTL
jgi:hypothetical protein